MPKKKFTIDRKNWLIPQNVTAEDRERFNEISGLFNIKTEKMCCLGFVCDQSGVDVQIMSDYDFKWPSDVAQYYADSDREDELSEIEFLTHQHSMSGHWYNKKWVNAVADINDADDISRQEKEKKIKAIFAGNGVDIEFVGEYDTNENEYAVTSD